jgi:hypothetical protein
VPTWLDCPGLFAGLLLLTHAAVSNLQDLLDVSERTYIGSDARCQARLVKNYQFLYLYVCTGPSDTCTAAPACSQYNRQLCSILTLISIITTRRYCCLEQGHILARPNLRNHCKIQSANLSHIHSNQPHPHSSCLLIIKTHINMPRPTCEQYKNSGKHGVKYMSPSIDVFDHAFTRWCLLEWFDTMKRQLQFKSPTPEQQGGGMHQAFPKVRRRRTLSGVQRCMFQGHH